ncbi:MAG TPA: TIGR03435 family protein, partial [Bryobacteraceae bacterium]|nr:TIGR03435 family protein [Bryobacteraceae bacterium]
WMSSEQYAVTAQPPEALRSQIHSIRYTLFNIDDPMLRRMLQSLLVDRFHLKFHQDSKTGEVYLLERNAKPLALHAAKIPAGASESVPFGSIGFAGGKWSLFDTTMPQLARYASSFILHAPVVDRTELTGVFDFRGAQPDLEPQYSGDQSTSFKAFLAQSGLKLERSKGEFQTFVIDEATRPSEN